MAKPPKKAKYLIEWATAQYAGKYYSLEEPKIESDKVEFLNTEGKRITLIRAGVRIEEL